MLSGSWSKFTMYCPDGVRSAFCAVFRGMVALGMEIVDGVSAVEGIVIR
jgi:hypothetical protein